jgi:hypothetical protein
MSENDSNPFRAIPMPLPLRGLHLTAPEVFTINVLLERIRINRKWLVAQPRTTRQIDAALFPHYEMAGMTRAEVFQQLNAALWEAGFRPDEVREDATWSLPPEALHPQDTLGDLWHGVSQERSQP